jgi:hypothetical protein
MNCAHHPETEAVGTCVACEQPLCETCREWVAGHAICRACLATEEERVKAEETSGPGAEPVEPTPAVPNLPPCGPVQYLKAILFAGAAAVLGAIIWDKFVLWTGFQLGLVAVAVGWAVGTALCMGAEWRPGKHLSWLGALMAAFGIMLGNALLLQDRLVRQSPEIASSLSAMPDLTRILRLIEFTPRTLDLLDWVFVAIGVWEGWSIPARLNRQAASAADAPPAAAPESPARGGERSG